MNDIEDIIEDTKTLRRDIDKIIQRLKKVSTEAPWCWEEGQRDAQGGNNGANRPGIGEQAAEALQSQGEESGNADFGVAAKGKNLRANAEVLPPSE